MRPHHNHRQQNQPIPNNLPIAIPESQPHEQSVIREQENQQDSSIELNDNTDVHYYDLDYSDEVGSEGDEDIEKQFESSDEGSPGREITHEEFMEMIQTNNMEKQRRNYRRNQSKGGRKKKEIYGNVSAGEYQLTPSTKNETFYRFSMSGRQQNYKNPYENKRSERRADSNNEHSSGFYGYQSQDPQKSNSFHKKNQNYNQKYPFNPNKPFHPTGSTFGRSHLNQSFHPDKVREFDPIIEDNKSNKNNNLYQFQRPFKNKPNSKNNQYNYQRPQKIPQSQPQEIDSDFTLITLPEYDDGDVNDGSNGRDPMGYGLESQAENNRRNKYEELRRRRNIESGGNSGEDQSAKTNQWRYQEAKLKFLDNFMPQSMKISKNPYNMLKYINQRKELTQNVMLALKH